jgi:hypothetical protein
VILRPDECRTGLPAPPLFDSDMYDDNSSPFIDGAESSLRPCHANKLIKRRAFSQLPGFLGESDFAEGQKAGEPEFGKAAAQPVFNLRRAAAVFPKTTHAK